MATKMKGFFKGFKNMFSGKEEEQEMQIGLPTDVKHLSHIGSDGSSNQAPSWMKEFQVSSDYTSASIHGHTESSWKGIIGEPEQYGNSSRSLNGSTTSRDESSKSSKKVRRKKKARNPGSPSSSTNSSSTFRNKTTSKLKSKSSKFRASCAAAMEDTCVGHHERELSVS